MRISLPLLVCALGLGTACSPGARPQPDPTPAPSAAATSTTEHLVQTQLEAYNRRDLEAFLATYAPDVRVYDHPDQLRLDGREAVRERYGRLFERAPELHATLERRMVQGDYVIDQERVGGLPGGETIRAVVVYQVRDGRIQNVWFIR